MVASEAWPWAKTGGLGDVMGALPRALAHQGHEVSLFLPLYRGMRERFAPARSLQRMAVRMHDGTEEAEVQAPREADTGVDVYAIAADRYFDRPYLYGEGSVDYADNARRYAFFCRAALGAIAQVGAPDVVHCHDWQTALIPAYLRGGVVGDDVAQLAREELSRARLILTVHNLGYQGLFPATDFAVAGLPRALFGVDGLEFHGKVSFLKAGLLFADQLTTVSPRYAREIRQPEHGAGLEGILAARAAHLAGILNGIDGEAWNPATDRHLAAPYDANDLRGKRRCKADLLVELELHGELDTPVAVVASRLDHQKGFDILLPSLPSLLERGLRVVVLGSGEPRIAAALRELAERERGRLAFREEFDEALEHKVQAGADMLLMPSRYEPCGLVQMLALRYGTIPIVRATGGLVDTVLDVGSSADLGTGFWIESHTADALIATVERALALFQQPVLWRGLVLRAMARDFSWVHAATRYAQLYRRTVLRSVARTTRPRIRLSAWGFRERIGEGFSSPVVRAVAQGVAEHLLAEEGSPAFAQQGMLVAHDTRFLGDDLAREAAGVLAANDFVVRWCPSPAPLPAVAHAVVERGLAGALVVTAGAAPRRWNGIVAVTAWGGPVDPETASAIEQRADGWMKQDRPPEAFSAREAVQLGLWRDDDVIESYRHRLEELVDVAAIRASGLRVATDLLWGTSAGILDRLLREWGVQGAVLHDGCDPSFGRIRPEPGPASLRTLADVVRSDHDLGVATDPAGCLLGVVDGDGTILLADHVLALLLGHLIETRPSRARRIGRSVATSQVLDAAARFQGLAVTETPTGFQELAQLVYRGEVLLAADELGACGIEGHVAYPDGILTALLVVEMVARRRRPLGVQLADLLRETGRRVLLRREVRLREGEGLVRSLGEPPDRLGEFPVRSVVTLDGLKLLLDGERWVLLRLLSLVPRLRMTAEATTEAEAGALLDLAQQVFVGRGRR